MKHHLSQNLLSVPKLYQVSLLETKKYSLKNTAVLPHNVLNDDINAIYFHRHIVTGELLILSYGVESNELRKPIMFPIKKAISLL